jgi:hypothetical protein
MYDVYVFSFVGHWPVGAFLTVVSEDLGKAQEMAQYQVAQMGLDESTVQLEKKMGTTLPGVYVVSDGQY